MSFKPVLKATLRSTSFKLLACYVVSCISIIFIVQSVSKLIMDYSEQKVNFRNQNRTKFAQLLAQELESGGNLNEGAARLEKELDIELRIENLHGEEILGAPDQTANIEQIEKTGIHKIWTPELKTGEFQGVSFTVVTLKDRRYLFLFRSAAFQELRLQWLSPMTALIVLILFANFVLIRWLFKPVAWLSSGIRRLGEGDFEVQVPCRSHDELGDLALSFNQTVERVRHIVESKKQLLLDVSHELRSPLTRIKVALELDGPKAKDHVRKNILMLESMIHDLLESARLESSQSALCLEPLDLTEVLRASISTVQDEKPGVILKNSTGPLFVRADRKKIETCMKNVLDNALKYSRFQDQPVEVVIEPGEGAGRVLVRDFGVGIPRSEREKIFEPFYQVDKSRFHETGGYGLGLSLCRKIMSAHGGRIDVESPSLGSGSVFILDFH